MTTTDKLNDLRRYAADTWENASNLPDFRDAAVDATYNWAIAVGHVGKADTDQAKGVAALLVIAVEAGVSFNSLVYEAEEALGLE